MDTREVRGHEQPAEIIGPITGWELYVINKYGGYNFSDDPKASPIYSWPRPAPAALAARSRSCCASRSSWCPRDALGSLPNKSAVDAVQGDHDLGHRHDLRHRADRRTVGARPHGAGVVLGADPGRRLRQRRGPQPARPGDHPVLERHPLQRERRGDGRTAHQSRWASRCETSCSVLKRQQPQCGPTGEANWPDPWKLQLEVEHRRRPDQQAVAGPDRASSTATRARCPHSTWRRPRQRALRPAVLPGLLPQAGVGDQASAISAPRTRMKLKILGNSGGGRTPSTCTPTTSASAPARPWPP
jgi:hypothetical protein